MRLLDVQKLLAAGPERYAVLSLIVVAVTAIQISPWIYESDPYIVIRTSILIMPLAVSVCCLMVFWAYGRSRIFGRSFFVLGAAYISVFVGEALYYFYLDPSRTQDIWTAVAEALFLVAYPLSIAHIAINVSYFVSRVGHWRVLPIVVPAITTIGYVVWVGTDITHEWMNIASVVGSSALLGYAVLAFILFRSTALSSFWMLLLGGISAGTAGDIVYRYAHALDSYVFDDPSTGLWLASNMVVAYALYRHHRSV